MSELGLLPPPPPRAGNRALAILVAALATAGLLAIALYWGSWAYAQRQRSLHEQRLAHLVEKKPRWDAVSQALRDEGMLPVTPAEEEAIRARAEVVAKSRRWPTTLAFASRDYVYVLYLDSQQILKDATYVAR
jgi:hypothetical protein